MTRLTQYLTRTRWSPARAVLIGAIGLLAMLAFSAPASAACQPCGEVCGMATGPDSSMPFLERQAGEHWKSQAGAICGSVQVHSMTRYFGCQPSGLSGEVSCGFCARPCRGESAFNPGNTPKPSGETEKLRYTLWNGSDTIVKFRLPSGKTYTLMPGERGSYSNAIRPGRKLEIVVLNTNRSYSLKPGNHKFFWNSKAKRIGFNKNYDKD